MCEERASTISTGRDSEMPRLSQIRRRGCFECEQTTSGGYQEGK